MTDGSFSHTNTPTRCGLRNPDAGLFGRLFTLLVTKVDPLQVHQEVHERAFVNVAGGQPANVSQIEQVPVSKLVDVLV
jgi:hypothetical protein